MELHYRDAQGQTPTGHQIDGHHASPHRGAHHAGRGEPPELHRRPEPFSLEIAGDAAGVTLLARCRDGSFVKQQVGGRYPQARVSEVAPEDDPLRLAEGE